MLDYGALPPGLVRWATIESLAFLAGVAALVVWSAVALLARRRPALFPDAFLIAGARRLGDPGMAIFGGLALLGATAVTRAAQLLRESGLSLAELSIAEPGPTVTLLARNRGLLVGALVARAALALLPALWPALRRHVATAHAVGIGAGLAILVGDCGAARAQVDAARARRR